MKRLHLASQGGLLCLGLLAMCSCGRSQDEAKPEEASAKTSAAKAAVAEALDRSYLPTAALANLEQLELDSQPPCSLTIESLRPALQSLADSREALETTTDKAAAVTLLSDLSASLAKHASGIENRSETDELKRFSAELRATLGDLAESLQLASIALSADDKPAAAANSRRIQNGVANTRSTIDGLIQQCAP
jgi:hypothetical protein